MPVNLSETIQMALFQCPERMHLIPFAPLFEPLLIGNRYNCPEARGSQTSTAKFVRYRVKC